MTLTEIKKELTDLFHQHYSEKDLTINQLPHSGSNRLYFRLNNSKETVIGTYNADIKENEAFFSFTNTFQQLGLRVPAVLAISNNKTFYLQSDLGNQTLFNSIWEGNNACNELLPLCHVKKSLKQLVQFQIQGGKHIDFSKCYPRDAFDAQSIQWDLNYFKYNFLKLAQIPFNEQLLENDFQKIIEYLTALPCNYFMFRDFQSRNIMMIDDEPWFIDYQGGRKGPLHYDLASILYSPKTKLSEAKKEILLKYYLEELATKIEVDKEQFTDEFYMVALVRIFQALGAYGYRGLFEKKSNFRNSIPAAIVNLDNIFCDKYIPVEMPEIWNIVQYLKKSDWAKPFKYSKDKLTVRVTSFSYKKGIPDDPSENGGGFAFDCRGLPNPGRYKHYKALNGTDKEVIDYLQQYTQVFDFQNRVREITKISLEEYLRRGFNHLCVNFGCTGGQHRSVYNAEKFAAWLENNFPVEVVLIHKEKNSWKRNE